MWDKELVNDLIELIIENLDTVKDRTKDIYCADDFSSNEQGVILLDSTCMKLAAIGESIKSLDKISNKQLLSNYSEVAGNKLWECAI